MTLSMHTICDSWFKGEKWDSFNDLTDKSNREMKTMKYILISLLMGSPGLPAVMAQQTDIIHTKPVKVEKYNGAAFLVTKKYYDGLERLVQSVDVGASAQNGKDVVSFVEYDNMGRADATVYLSFVAASGTNNGARISNPAGAQQTFYQNYLPSTDPDRNYTFAQKQYEASPRNLVLKEGGFGASNNITTGKTVNHQYLLNNYSEIKKFMVNGSGQLVYKGFYTGGVLKVHRSYSGTGGEDHDTYEYVNQEGQLVASEAYISSTDRRITYYVYDDLGRQRYVIPPIQESLITAPGAAYNPADLKKYCYYSEYDERGNLIRQWNPGGICTSNVYDLLDRLVLSQNPVMAASNQWSFIKYDSQNRPIATGTTTVSGTAESVANALKTHMTSSVYDLSFEERGTGLHGYTNKCYPTNVTQSQVLNVTYYDDYDWITDAAKYGFSTVDAIAGTAKTANNVTGHATGTKTKVLGIPGDQWLTSVTYYDKDYNAIQTVSDLYPSGVEIVSNKHNFNGQVVQTKVKQTVNGVAYEYNKWFDYDGYGRLLKIRQKITGDPQNEVVLAEYTYDDLGQTVSKKIHGNKEQTAYAYDINGRNISTSSPSFSYKLGYDKSVVSGVSGRTDGIISQISWGNNATGDQKAYAFTYDKLGQYTSATYYEKSGSSWTSSAKYKETIGSYDKNGNILSLQRTNASETLLHNLSYTYASATDGNVLTKVSGSADFLYDANGNMTRDGMTGVQIEYNILNLPQKIYKGSDQITYIYTANGRKLATQTGSSLTYYRSVMVYSKNGTAAEQLMYMLQPEGLVAREGSAWVYKYYKTDYLGNTRALLAVRNGTLVNELQNTDYYPLGYAHSLANLQLNKYLYSGKEYQDASIGGSPLGLYDFGARYYNPLLARWFNPDPANQFANPYIYCGNNPLMFVDPDGRFAFWLIPVIGALIGGATYTASVAFSEGGFSNWSWGGFFQSMGIGAVSGLASYGIGYVFDIALSGSGIGSFGIEMGRGISHGLVQGGLSALDGGDFWSGAASGTIGSWSAKLYGFSDLGRTKVGSYLFSGISGGAGAAATGGNFWRGAASGISVAAFNHGLHELKQECILEKYTEMVEGGKKGYRYMMNQSLIFQAELAGYEVDDNKLIIQGSQKNTMVFCDVDFVDRGGASYVYHNEARYKINSFVHTHPQNLSTYSISPEDRNAFRDVFSPRNIPFKILQSNTVYLLTSPSTYEIIGSY